MLTASPQNRITEATDRLAEAVTVRPTHMNRMEVDTIKAPGIHMLRMVATLMLSSQPHHSLRTEEDEHNSLDMTAGHSKEGMTIDMVEVVLRRLLQVVPHMVRMHRYFMTVILLTPDSWRQRCGNGAHEWSNRRHIWSHSQSRP